MGLIRWHCLVMSENYISARFPDIQKYANVVESRLDDDRTLESVLKENARYLELAQKYRVPYILINDNLE